MRGCYGGNDRGGFGYVGNIGCVSIIELGSTYNPSSLVEEPEILAVAFKSNLAVSVNLSHAKNSALQLPTVDVMFTGQDDRWIFNRLEEYPAP